MDSLKVLIFVVMVVVMACAPKTEFEIKEPKKLPMSEQAKEIVKMPEYLETSEDGLIAPIGKGMEAPFNGILMSEDEAFLTADLRIEYEDLYRSTSAHIKYLLILIESQERELIRGDQLILHKQALIDRKNLTWWERNKVGMSISIGIVVGAALVLATGGVWALIEEGNKNE